MRRGIGRFNVGGTGGTPVSRSQGAKRGVALYVHDAEDATRALVALFSLRQKYRGPLAVVMRGKEVPALRIACARAGAVYVGIAEEAKGGWEMAMEYSPFAETVMVFTDSRMPSVGKWARGRVGVSPAGSGILPGPSERRAASPTGKGTRSDAGVIQAGRLPYPMPVISDGDALWFVKGNAVRIVSKRGARLVSPEAEAALVAANPAHVWFPADCTVLAAATGEDMEALEKNWRSIRWPAGMPRFLSTEDTEEHGNNVSTKDTKGHEKKADVTSRVLAPFASLADQNPSVSSVDIPARVVRDFADQPYWIQAMIAVAAQCKTKRLLYLDPCMRPVPGAELFYRDVDQAAAYASAGWCFVRRGKKVLKTPKLGPPATLVDVRFFRQAAKAFAAEKKERNLEVFIHAFAKKGKRTVTVQDVMPCGWNR